MSYYDRQYYKPTGFGSFSFFPPVLKSLLIINVVIYFIQVIAGNILIDNVTLDDLIVYYFGLIPLHFPYASFYPWQVITYQFLHANFTHIFFNMFMLWMFGMELENIWGSSKFLIFYLLSGIGGALLQLFVGGGAPTIGASGAIFGVMVAFAMMFPDRPIYLYFLLPIKAKYLIAFLVVFEFLSVGSADVIAHVVHIGGAITGFLFILADRRYNFDFDRMYRNLKNPNVFKQTKTKIDRNKHVFGFPEDEVEDADFYEIDGSPKSKKEFDQEEIDRILDKISKSGYQNLTDEEKRILFEASKKDY